MPLMPRRGKTIIGGAHPKTRRGWSSPQAMAGIEAGARDLAMEHARLAYSGAFSAALLVAAVIAGFSKVLVGVLMRERK